MTDPGGSMVGVGQAYYAVRPTKEKGNTTEIHQPGKGTKACGEVRDLQKLSSYSWTQVT